MTQAAGRVKAFDIPSPKGYDKDFSAWRREYSQTDILKSSSDAIGEKAEQIAAHIIQHVDQNNTNKVRKELESRVKVCGEQAVFHVEIMILFKLMDCGRGDIVLLMFQPGDRWPPLASMHHSGVPVTILLNFVGALVNEHLKPNHDSWKNQVLISMLSSLDLSPLKTELFLWHCPSEFAVRYRNYRADYSHGSSRRWRHDSLREIYGKRTEPYPEGAEELAGQIMVEVEENRGKSEWESPFLKRTRDLTPEVIAAAFRRIYLSQSNGPAIVCWVWAAMPPVEQKMISEAIGHHSWFMAHALGAFCVMSRQGHFGLPDVEQIRGLVRNGHFNGADVALMRAYFTPAVGDGLRRYSRRDYLSVVGIFYAVMSQDAFVKTMGWFGSYSTLELVIEHITQSCIAGEMPWEVLYKMIADKPNYLLPPWGWTKSHWRIASIYLPVGDLRVEEHFNELRLAHGDDRAFVEMCLNDPGFSMFQHIYLLLKNISKDIVADVFCALHKKSGSSPDGGLIAWDFRNRHWRYWNFHHNEFMPTMILPEVEASFIEDYNQLVDVLDRRGFTFGLHYDDTPVSASFCKIPVPSGSRDPDSPLMPLSLVPAGSGAPEFSEGEAAPVSGGKGNSDDTGESFERPWPETIGFGGELTGVPKESLKCEVSGSDGECRESGELGGMAEELPESPEDEAIGSDGEYSEVEEFSEYDEFDECEATPVGGNGDVDKIVELLRTRDLSTAQGVFLSFLNGVELEELWDMHFEAQDLGHIRAKMKGRDLALSNDVIVQILLGVGPERVCELLAMCPTRYYALMLAGWSVEDLVNLLMGSGARKDYNAFGQALKVAQGLGNDDLVRRLIGMVPRKSMANTLWLSGVLMARPPCKCAFWHEIASLLVDFLESGDMLGAINVLAFIGSYRGEDAIGEILPLLRARVSQETCECFIFEFRRIFGRFAGLAPGSIARKAKSAGMSLNAEVPETAELDECDGSQWRKLDMSGDECGSEVADFDDEDVEECAEEDPGPDPASPPSNGDQGGEEPGDHVEADAASDFQGADEDVCPANGDGHGQDNNQDCFHPLIPGMPVEDIPQGAAECRRDPEEGASNGEEGEPLAEAGEEGG
jgi:hypothetical protein